MHFTTYLREVITLNQEIKDVIGVFSESLTSAESRISKVEEVVSSLTSWEATCYWTKLSGTPAESGRPWKQKPEIQHETRRITESWTREIPVFLQSWTVSKFRGCSSFGARLRRNVFVLFPYCYSILNFKL